MKASTRSIFSVLIAIGACRCTSAPEVRSYPSPSTDRTIELRGTFHATRSPFLNRVDATVSSGRQRPIQVGTIYDFDWFDTPFDAMYGRGTWVNEHIFRLPLDSQAVARDRVVISNNTNDTLVYVLLRLRDVVIALDLEAGVSADADITKSTNTTTADVMARACCVNGAPLSGERLFQHVSETDMNLFQVRVDPTALTLSVRNEKE